MALNVKYQQVFGVPVSPDSISVGSISIASPQVITGDLVLPVSLSSRTYTFTLQGVSQGKADEIINACVANTESLVKGEIDINQPTGIGQFVYNGVQCLPFSYEEGGTLQIGDGTVNYQSFAVTCLTDLTVASV